MVWVSDPDDARDVAPRIGIRKLGQLVNGEISTKVQVTAAALSCLTKEVKNKEAGFASRYDANAMTMMWCLSLHFLPEHHATADELTWVRARTTTRLLA